MINAISDAHHHEHTPKLIINDPDSLRITDVKTIELPNKNFPKMMNTYTRIYFSYQEEMYYVTEEFNPEIDSSNRIEEGYNIQLYHKDDGEYKLFDYVFDGFTHLNRIRQQKELLIIRLTDIKLLGGCAEPEVEQLHKDLEELSKKRKLIHEKLYP